MSRLTQSLAAKPYPPLPVCRRCRSKPTSHTVRFTVNEVGPARNGCGPTIGSRNRTVCEDCATELTIAILPIFDRGES